MADPIDIKKAQKKKENGPVSEKIPAADLYLAVAEAINKSQWTRLPEFPLRVHLIEPDDGTKIPLVELGDQVVKQTTAKHVVNSIIGYTNAQLMGFKDYRFTVQQARYAYDYWEAATPAIAPPAMVSWQGDDGLTYRRLPWARGGGETPVWDELTGRMGDQEAPFMAWIGSLFFDDSDRQQYLWLYGEGQNGKGAITRFLAKTFGPAFRSELPPSPDDRFWTRWLLGARIISFPDCNAAAFPASGLFKSLTGDDALRMEIKGGASFCAPIIAKFLFSSNEKPTLSSELADLRRAIFVNLGAIPGKPDPTYEAKLWEEGGRFLSNCIDLYQGYYPNHGRIDVDESELLAHVKTIEEEFEVVVAAEFVTFTPSAGLLRNAPSVTPAKMQEVLRRAFPEAKAKAKFLKYLEINHKVKKTRMRLEDGTIAWRYPWIEGR